MRTITIVLACTAVLGGCSASSSFPGSGGDGITLKGSTAPATATLFAPGVISDANRQWRITFTPDGRTAYFAESEGFFPVTRQATIHVSHLENGAWTEPRVAPFSGTYSDIDPFITPTASASTSPRFALSRG